MTKTPTMNAKTRTAATPPMMGAIGVDFLSSLLSPFPLLSPPDELDGLAGLGLLGEPLEVVFVGGFGLVPPAFVVVAPGSGTGETGGLGSIVGIGGVAGDVVVVGALVGGTGGTTLAGGVGDTVGGRV